MVEPIIDCMAFGPHPDDVELGCAGTLIKLRTRGRSVVVVDLTQGELSTRGDIHQRRREALEASRIIGTHARENLELEDGNITNTPESRLKVIRVVRRYRPAMVLLPYYHDRHPDHVHASELVYDALFASGLPRIETDQPAYRPDRLAWYLLWDEFQPTFVVDISQEYQDKLRAVGAYRTQFTTQDPSWPETRLTGSKFARERETRAGYYGSLIGASYGEPFLIRGQLEMASPLEAQYHSF